MQDKIFKTIFEVKVNPILFLDKSSRIAISFRDDEFIKHGDNLVKYARDIPYLILKDENDKDPITSSSCYKIAHEKLKDTKFISTALAVFMLRELKELYKLYKNGNRVDFERYYSQVLSKLMNNYNSKFRDPNLIFLAKNHSYKHSNSRASKLKNTFSSLFRHIDKERLDIESASSNDIVYKINEIFPELTEEIKSEIEKNPTKFNKLECYSINESSLKIDRKYKNIPIPDDEDRETFQYPLWYTDDHPTRHLLFVVKDRDHYNDNLELKRYLREKKKKIMIVDLFSFSEQKSLSDVLIKTLRDELKSAIYEDIRLVAVGVNHDELKISDNSIKINFSNNKFIIQHIFIHESSLSKKIDNLLKEFYLIAQ